MDSILSGIPPTAVRALFSATVTPMVRSLAESILRNPVDLTVSSHSKAGGIGGANGDIDQELRFVGREEGKLLALRQMKARGELRPPALVFLQSQERAQARCCTTGCTWMSFTPVGPGNGPWPNSPFAHLGRHVHSPHWTDRTSRTTGQGHYALYRSRLCTTTIHCQRDETKRVRGTRMDADVAKEEEKE